MENTPFVNIIKGCKWLKAAESNVILATKVKRGKKKQERDTIYTLQKPEKAHWFPLVTEFR